MRNCDWQPSRKKSGHLALLLAVIAWACCPGGLRGADPADASHDAADPAPAAATLDLDHWAFQPVSRPALPEVNAAAWPANAIDRFVLAELEAAGFEPAGPLPKSKLARRLYFDLWGLPPSAEEAAAFEADDSPDAIERLVDRLLGSPHYGERWGRHWLDRVRFAETNGYERDAVKENAWRYRDWVIQAFNDDLPYDRFVLEQLAGDELADADESTWIATGLLRVGTFDDEPNDPLQYQFEQLDDLVHVTGTAFLALTIKCARCHDHKFDPIPQRDYYALLNFFRGGRASEGPLLAYTDAGREAPEVRLLKGGDPRQEGEIVPPGYLSLAPALDRAVDSPPAESKTTTRRTQLARWIVDRQNPLTPRVAANFLWQHHLGQGLVRTPDNFGVMGSMPTHPELLDWLAAELVESGWRLKRLHRLIVLSRTYQMDSTHPRQTEYAARDFDNERWWRANRRRLEAEALRDAMLTASGQIDLTVGGPSFVPPVSAAALEGLSMKEAAWKPSPPEQQRRRSVYMFAKRSLASPFMAAFDMADTTQPCCQRNVSTVAPQALVLLNNEFVHQQSDALAARVLGEAGGDDVGSNAARRVDRAWQLALSRSPTQSECQAAIEHLAAQRRRFEALAAARGTRSDADSDAPSGDQPPASSADRLAWQSLCHVLLNLNEFLYVD